MSVNLPAGQTLTLKIFVVDVDRELVPVGFCRPIVSKINFTQGKILLHILPVSQGVQF